ncbi:MAG: DUF3048 domain-containing protein [Patescibacteria group bacterium]
MISKESIVNFLSSRVLMKVLTFSGIFLLSLGVSWAVFSFLRGNPNLSTIPSEVKNTRSKINLDAPKVEVCPINGAKFTKGEKDIWQGRRPITAVIENHVDSRPPSGLSKADVVYEAIAEGGITRFLSILYCGVAASDVRIGPVRSARVYFINWASEYGNAPLFLHSGGANNICNNCPGGVKEPGTVAKEADAFRLLTEMGWRYANGNALDAGTSIGFPAVVRDYERIPGVATEHTFMAFTDKLYEEAQKRGFGAKDKKGNSWEKDFVEWKFIDDQPAGSPNASDISFGFWQNKKDYDIEWKYDKTGNKYLRFNGGKEHIDLDNKEQLSAKNVIVMFLAEKGPVDKEGHMFYKNIGKGNIMLFQNGIASKGSWSKESKTARTKFFNEKGAEIQFVRGVIWIEGLPVGNEVVYN